MIAVAQGNPAGPADWGTSHPTPYRTIAPRKPAAAIPNAVFIVIDRLEFDSDVRRFL